MVCASRRQILIGVAGALTGAVGVSTLAACNSNTPAGQPAGEDSAGLPAGWRRVVGPVVASTTIKSPELPTSFVDGTGAKVEVKDLSKIIVAGDGIASLLGSFGLADKIFAAPKAARSVEAAKAQQRYEFTKQTGAEGLLAMNGTLFIGDNIQRHEAVAKQFRDAGTAACVLDDQLPLKQKITTLGSYVGLAATGTSWAETLQKDFDDAKNKVGGSGAGVRIIQITASGAGGRPAVAGTGTPGSELIAALGATSIGVEAKLRRYSVELNGEALLASAPNLILITEADLQAWPNGDGLWQAFPTLAQTPAGQAKRVVVMPDAQLGYDSTAIGVGAKSLAEFLVSNPISG